MITESDVSRLNRQAHDKAVAAGSEEMSIDEFWAWAETALTEDEATAMLVTMKQTQDAQE